MKYKLALGNGLTLIGVFILLDAIAYAYSNAFNPDSSWKQILARIFLGLLIGIVGYFMRITGQIQIEQDKDLEHKETEYLANSQKEKNNGKIT
jgi:hypothetical protein